LFAFEKVPTLSEADLDSVLIGASELTGIPVLIDRPGLEAKGIELSQTKVSFLQKRTTWGLVLSELLFKAKAKHELLIDEAGHPFLWITHVGVPRRAQKDQ
jgi:hypothetical protein